MALTMQEQIYEPFGRVLAVSNGTAEILITLDCGPNIISYKLLGGENMFHNDISRTALTTGAQMDEYYGEGAYWHNRGGHRLWVSPEALPETYYPDNEPVAYEVQGDQVLLTPPAQKKNLWQYLITVEMDKEGSGVTVTHRVINLGQERKAAAWAITVMSQKGVEIIPQPDRPTGLLSNRIFAVWPYADMSDPRICWGRNYITLTQDPSATENFKIGLNNEHGWAASLNHGCCFVKRFSHQMSGEYPDCGISFETYTCPTFTEVETLSPLHTLKTGEWMEHQEHWELFPVQQIPSGKDMAAVEAFCAEYLK